MLVTHVTKSIMAFQLQLKCNELVWSSDILEWQ